MPLTLDQLEAQVAILQAQVAVLNGGGGSGGGACCVVWRPGVPSSGNVFDTFAEVTAAVALLNGEVTIGLDTDTAPAVIPAGNYDLRPPGVSGPVYFVNASKAAPPVPSPFFTIAAAAVTIHGLSGLIDVSVINHSTVPVITISTNTGTFLLSGRAAIRQALANPFLAYNGGRNSFILEGRGVIASFAGGIDAVSVSAPAILDVGIFGDSFFGQDMLAAIPGSVNIIVGYDGVFQTQATATTIVPLKNRQVGTTTIDGLTGKSPPITAMITANSRIVCPVRIPVGDGGPSPTTHYEALDADRVLGQSGSFQISALTITGGGTTNPSDASLVDFIIFD